MAYTPVPSVAAGDWIDEIFINTYWRDNMAASVPDVFSAKGQLAVGTGVDTMGVLSVGANNTILVADSTQVTGLKWDSLFNQIYGPQGFAVNYRIFRTVASNNLTVALKDKDGNDPSASSPISFRIGTAQRSLTSALSLTRNAGADTWDLGRAETASQDTDVFVYIGWRASDSSLFIALSRIPCAVTYGDFSGTTSRAAIASGTTPASTDEVEVIGRFNIFLSASPNYNFSIPTTSVVIDHPIWNTRLMTWLPTLTGYSAAPTSASYTYLIPSSPKTKDRLWIPLFIVEGVSGTSNGTSKQYTLPLVGVTAISGPAVALSEIVNNGASEAAGIGRIIGAPRILDCYRSTGTIWTSSGGAKIGGCQTGYWA